MGLNTRIPCPIPDCEYVAGVRLGMGEETNPAAWQEWEDSLRDEHPNHPLKDS